MSSFEIFILGRIFKNIGYQLKNIYLSEFEINENFSKMVYFVYLTPSIFIKLKLHTYVNTKGIIKNINELILKEFYRFFSVIDREVDEKKLYQVFSFLIY